MHPLRCSPKSSIPNVNGNVTGNVNGDATGNANGSVNGNVNGAHSMKMEVLEVSRRYLGLG